MSEQTEHNVSVEKKEKPKHPGMKWVIFADIWGAIIIGLLVFSNILNQRSAQEEAFVTQNAVENVEKQSAGVPNYDYVLPLSPQNCDGVSGALDIVLITDANYMDFTRVAIQSAKENKCPDSQYRFHVMTMDISESDYKALKALETENVSVRVLPQEEANLFYIRDTHVSKTSLLKYYITEALPELDKVLYIDSDVLVLHDLNKLYQTDVSNVYLAAVKDPSWFFQNTHVLELNLEERGFYFNSGVMLMNLAKIRQDGLVQKLEEFTNNNFRTYMDQDAFNVVVGNDVLLLPVEDNTMNFFFEYNELATLAEFYGRDWKNYEEVFSPATILHFASSKKPLGPAAESNQFFRMLQRLWYKYYEPLPPLD